MEMTSSEDSLVHGSQREVRRQSQTSVTASDDLISRVDIAEVPDGEEYQSLSTSAVLFHCKQKILKPYLRLLAVMGLRPFGVDRPMIPKWLSIFGYLHLSQVILFMIVGYILQYMACFRRDRGFCYETYPKTLKLVMDHKQICYGSVVFSYIVPSLLHFVAYLYALYLFRFKDDEQLENLMERTFLLSAHRANGPARQKTVVRNLWIYISFSILWMALSLSSVIVMMSQGRVVFQWISNTDYKHIKTLLEVLLIIATLWHDMVQATIITSYCLQVQLLTSNLYFLKDKLLQHTIHPLNWIREIAEFQILLNYLNDDFAPTVCLFTFINISWATAGTTWLLKYDLIDNVTQPIAIVNIVNVALWVLMATAPFVMSARLSSACNKLRGLGHEVRIRPFVYQDTPGEDLDTILLYTSSLRMKARLFNIPIRERYLYILLCGGCILILTMGQCHMFTVV